MPPETWHVAYAAGQRRKISIAIALHFAACRIPTTAIERDAGLIQRATILADSSGE
jgi:hypothetical protein